MNTDEFMIFSKAMKHYFPKDNLMPNKDAITLWFDALKDIPYPSAAAFLQKWIRTEKFSPTIAEIRKGCSEITMDRVPDWGEAWCEVQNMIRKVGYMRSDLAKKRLSPIAWKAINAIGGWQHLCESEDGMSDRANFRQCYEIYAKQEQEDRQIPDALKETIDNLRIGAMNSMALPQAE